MLSHLLLIDFKSSLLIRVKELFPNANILVYGYETRVDKIAKILGAGAKGYFLLSSKREELAEALRLVNRGLMWAPGEALALMINQMKKGRAKEPKIGTKELVTPYELMILRMLRKGMSNKEIASRLNVAEITIKSHLSKLYKRFNVGTRLQLLSYAIEHNLIIGDESKRYAH